MIGAGMAGVACARALRDAGRDVLVLDKGRGLGGRMASRRTERGPLDHGAPWLSAERAGFAAVIDAMAAAGCAAPWTGPGGRALHVGLPAMSGALRAMAEGVERRQGHEVREARRAGCGWRLTVETAEAAVEVAAGTLVSTVPVPQAHALLGDEPGLEEAMAPASLDPCWTLLAWLDPPAAIPALRGEGDVAWLSDEGAKPGRAPSGVVLQASAGWTRPRLEMKREDVAVELTALLREATGASAPAWTAAHRWRYSRTAVAAGAPFLAAQALRVGGDWCLGPRVEDAWESGTAIARDLLAVGGAAA